MQRRRGLNRERTLLHAGCHGLGRGSCAGTAGVGQSSEISLGRRQTDIPKSPRTDRCCVLSSSYEDFWAERAGTLPIQAEIPT